MGDRTPAVISATIQLRQSRNSAFIMINKKTKNDIILFSVLLLLSLIILIAVTLTRKDGSYAEIKVDGELYGVYSLNEDRVIDIGDTNHIVISEGYVYMESADCPDRTCVKRGKISKSGESIVCLPNRVTVTIKASSGGGLDAVAE